MIKQPQQPPKQTLENPESPEKPLRLNVSTSVDISVPARAVRAVVISLFLALAVIGAAAFFKPLIVIGGLGGKVSGESKFETGPKGMALSAPGEHDVLHGVQVLG